ncbi:hypothetical protein MHH33_08950 [Paenisporosarcina sp. FSL H8-0542]|uniref:hypothetical protein n=1 Tax=Paenisporosarcina sp. FSL H8-0542 TaxID=2921401 RepID=UPI00315A6364
MGMIITIYSNKHIGIEKYANSFFDLIFDKGLKIEKIGLFEPINKTFDIEDAIKMWTKQEPGIYDFETNKMIGKAGGMLGKGKGFWFSTNWWLHPNELSLNHFTLFINKKLFNKIKKDILTLFGELVYSFEAIYGYVTEEVAEDRQHTTGKLTERIPGVFWLNFFSSVFVDYLNKDNNLFEFPWVNIKDFKKGGIITQLTESPFDETILDFEKKAQEALGLSKFNGNVNDYPNLLIL